MKFVKKLGFVMLLALSSGCSVPYWIVLSYDYKNKDEKDCIQKVIQTKHKETYVNRYGDLYLQTTLPLSSGANNGSLLIMTLLVESTSEQVVYKLKWTGADRDVMAHMSKEVNVLNVAQKAKTNFSSVLGFCINDYKINCVSRVYVEGVIPFCIDE